MHIVCYVIICSTNSGPLYVYIHVSYAMITTREEVI